MILVLNFSHPFTAAQREQLILQLGIEIEVRVIQVHIHNECALAEQAILIADATKLSAEEWQTLTLIVNPPGYAPLAMALLAELHGRIGHFPTLVQLRPVAGSTPTTYEVVELLNLQAIREAARNR